MIYPEEKKNEEKQQNLRHLWDMTKSTNMHIMGVQKEKKKVEKSFWKNDDQNLTTLGKKYSSTHLRKSRNSKQDNL